MGDAFSDHGCPPVEIECKQCGYKAKWGDPMFYYCHKCRWSFGKKVDPDWKAKQETEKESKNISYRTIGGKWDDLGKYEDEE